MKGKKKKKKIVPEMYLVYANLVASETMAVAGAKVLPTLAT